MIKNINEDLEEFNNSLIHMEGIIQGITGVDKPAVKKLGKRNGNI